MTGEIRVVPAPWSCAWSFWLLSALYACQGLHCGWVQLPAVAQLLPCWQSLLLPAEHNRLHFSVLLCS